MLALVLMLALVADGERKSGAEFMSPATQAMQRDDSQNPAMLWSADGAALWKAGAASCASCHGEAAASMRGVAPRYPAIDSHSKLPLNLAARINQCRQQRQHLPALAPESRDLLSLEAFVALQSRGMALAPPPQPALVERGRQRYLARIGQLNMSCAQCHDEHAGRRLAGSVIPQGHATAYPLYRLEWQDLGSLQRRLRNCMSGVRAQVPPYGAAELIELEAYLAARAAGMPLESPGVRP
jgi:sulfur-oxidizing protein SoxA